MAAVSKVGPRGFSSRGGMVNGIIALAILLVILPLALRAAPPPPPEIAEFAPQAQQIKEPPKEQTSNVGKAGGEGRGLGIGPGQGAGGLPATPLPSPSSFVATARQLHCVGNRQIEDPQSPPCIASWQGNNGGATAPGVTADTINIYVWGVDWQNDISHTTWATAFEAFFNSRFEFYGRNIHLFFPRTQCGEDSPQVLLQNAATVQAQNSFASTPYCYADADESLYYQELARRKVVAIAAVPEHLTESAFYGPNDPYIWTQMPAMDRMEAHIADYACNGLAGKKAQFAGDPTLAAKPRKFGVVYTYSDAGGGPDPKPLTDALAACNHPVDKQDVYPVYIHDSVNYHTFLTQMKQDNVTTLICLCLNGDTGEMMHEGDGLSYLPEWYLSSYYGAESERHARLYYPPDQARSVFVLSLLNKLLPTAQEPWYWACKEINPSGCTDDQADTTKVVYRSLLMLASGIQMAGPHLTPQSFGAALHQTVFPDPAHGAPPFYQAGVGFGPDHAFNDDGTLLWWSPTATSVEQTSDQGGSGPGALCYANHGERYTIGHYPKTDTTLFSGSCY